MNSKESVEAAQKYLADMLTFFGINVQVEARVEDDVIELDVPSSDSNSILIGRGAETLRSLQLLVSTMLRTKNAEIARVNVDVAGYKAQRAEKVAAQAKEWIEQVLQTGDSHVANLNAADRRVVHKVAAEYPNIQTFSEGEGRERKIIIAQQSS